MSTYPTHNILAALEVTPMDNQHKVHLGKVCVHHFDSTKNYYQMEIRHSQIQIQTFHNLSGSSGRHFGMQMDDLLDKQL